MKLKRERGQYPTPLSMHRCDFGLSLASQTTTLKNALHLNGLTGESLKTHKNYNFYKYFLEKNEDFLLSKWFRHEITTTQAWGELGFQYITKAEQLHLIKNTDQFRAYKRYVNAFDKDVLLTMKMGDDPPRVIIARGASDAEITARTQIMAEAGRSDAYAKLALGMTETFPPRNVLRGAALEAHADFKYFLLFLREREPAMRDELARLEKLAKLSSRQREAQREMLGDLQLIEKYRPRNGGDQ